MQIYICHGGLGFFANSSQYKNANEGNFNCVIRKELDQWGLQPWNIITSTDIYFHLNTMWEYKVGNNANIAILCLWKTRLNDDWSDWFLYLTYLQI